MSSLGIYFGSKAFYILESQGKKIINNIAIPQTSVGDDLEAKPSYENQTIEIIASFKESFRKNNINAKEAAICLSGKDLLIRTFEIPDLPKEELQSAINFEVKKYIPFKVEDLNTDFQLESSRGEKTKLVLFAGIKKETLDRYLSLFNQLGIKIKSIEYSSVSLLRVAKIASSLDSGVVCFVSVDSRADDESNFLVTENGFPLFTRDISLIGMPESMASAETDSTAFLEKMKSEIRVSLDYYNRKFPNKGIKKMYVLSSKTHFLELQAFLTEIGLASKFVDAEKLLGSPQGYSSGSAKGYGASLFKLTSTKVAIDLLKVKIAAAKGPQPAFPSLKDIKIDFSVINIKAIILGGLICAAAFGFGIYNNLPLRQELNTIISERVPAASVSPNASLEEITQIDSEYKRKLDNLDGLIKKQLYVTEPLDLIPRVVPEGVWLTKFTFSKKEDAGAELALEGLSFLLDDTKEFEAVNKFVTNLKENPEFSNYFKDINIISMDKSEVENSVVTHFSIVCKSNVDKKSRR